MNTRIVVLFLLCLVVGLACGCSTVQTRANFRDKIIFVGQSNDSVENLLGQPDLIASARLNPDAMKVKRIDPWIFSGDSTIEWVYWDDPQSLLLWLEGNAVKGIWLAETSRIK